MKIDSDLINDTAVLLAVTELLHHVGIKKTYKEYIEEAKQYLEHVTHD